MESDKVAYRLVSRKNITPDGHLLGNWLQKKRKQRNNGTIDPAAEKQPNAIGVDLSLTTAAKRSLTEQQRATDIWNAWYQRLLEYQQNFGHANVATKYKTPDGYSLGKCLGQQRSDKKKGTLATEHEEKLIAIEVIWDVDEAQWGNGFTHFLAYVHEFNTTHILSTYKTSDGYPLGQ